MLNCRISAEYGARCPTEGQTTLDAPISYVTLFADFFNEGNFRLPLTIFMADLLEYYKIHISLLSPLGMVRAHHFEYCFQSQWLEPTIEHFRRFYQLQAQLGFYSFYALKGVAVVCRLEVRSVFQHILKEMLALPISQEWYEELQAFPLVVVSNKGFIVLCMMMRWKAGSKLKPVCRENGSVVQLWRMFAPDNEVKITTKPFDDGEEGWYETIIRNFRMPEGSVLEALLPAGLSMCVIYFSTLSCAGVPFLRVES
ncbi:hypothetical protein Hanom_Chr04g00344951 [Helianthus anomalus]